MFVLSGTELDPEAKVTTVKHEPTGYWNKELRPLPASFQSLPQAFRIPMRASLYVPADILRFYDLIWSGA